MVAAMMEDSAQNPHADSRPVVALIQVRMTSTRLPGKVLLDLAGKPALHWMLERLRRARLIDRIVVATTELSSDDPVAAFCREQGIDVFRGDEHDVLGRFAAAAAAFDARTVVRLTGDCPMIDPQVVDRVIGRYLEGGLDYCSNYIERSYPIGLDTEVFSRAVLDRCQREAVSAYAREHVTPLMRDADPEQPGLSLRRGHVRHEADFSHIRWTLDTPEDLALLRRYFDGLPADFTWQQALAAATRDPSLLVVSETPEARTLRLHGTPT